MTNEYRCKIFAAHLGCNFRYAGSIANIRKLAGINRRYSVEEEAPTGDSYRIDRCQLILTPLSEISDEHARGIARIARPDITDNEHLLNIGRSICINLIRGNVLLEIGFNRIRGIITYCQRNSIDVGYDDIPSLIEAGIAVKS